MRAAPAYSAFKLLVRAAVLFMTKLMAVEAAAPALLPPAPPIPIVSMSLLDSANTVRVSEETSLCLSEALRAAVVSVLTRLTATPTPIPTP